MPQSILMVFRGSPKDETLLEMVCRLAKFHNARVTAARFVVIPMALAIDDEDAPGLREANALLDRAERLAREHGVKIETDVYAVREAGAAIVQAASDLGVDMVVMEFGLEQEEGIAEQNRRVVDLVLDRAPCEVWVARM